MNDFDPDTILMEAISFTDDDLEANHDGYMTKAQRVRLSGERRLWTVIAAMMHDILIEYPFSLLRLL